ncbi:MAG: hypothetical protein AMS16_05415 [Planctomycetes bacterium DG_58]|nr:MAG: hypothetical protein AMS16_05415 [Planctomycetes bacterium DG_58]KPL02164.1 MAG: hypothetical protein AMK75_03165 [Planctomycetes bacterium SM23_65]
MPRRPRVSVGGMVYHVLNRANGRMPLFESPRDYDAFEKVLLEAHEHVSMRTLAYCVMPNHWHFVLWPHEDGDLPKFMQWLTLTHTQRWHLAHETTGNGHVYQGRYKSFPIQSDKHYLTVCRYVERNALRAGLVHRAEEWPWGSLGGRTSGRSGQINVLSDGPMDWPDGWLEMVNQPMSEREEEALRRCLLRSRPFGTRSWVATTFQLLGLPAQPARVGRPRRRK